MEALDTIDSDISAAQAKLEEIQAQIEQKRRAVAGVNAEIEVALEKLAVVRDETSLAQLYHDQILDSAQSLRRQFACLRSSDRLKNAVDSAPAIIHRAKRSMAPDTLCGIPGGRYFRISMIVLASLAAPAHHRRLYAFRASRQTATA